MGDVCFLFYLFRLSLIYLFIFFEKGREDGGEEGKK